MNEFNEENYHTRQQLKSIGEKLPMTSSWADIKVGETYHLPPINEKPRRTFTVLDKSAYWVRVKYKDSIKEDNTTFHYIYSYDIDSKFITEIKN